MIRFTWCILLSWPLCSHLKDTLNNLKVLLKKTFSSFEGFHTTRPLSLLRKSSWHLLTPITEEHTKLLDRLSEPSSRLSHCISHPPKEDVSAEVVTACFSGIQVHGLPSACLLSVKRASLSSSTAKNRLRSKLLSNTWPVLNYSPLQTMPKAYYTGFNLIIRYWAKVLELPHMWHKDSAMPSYRSHIRTFCPVDRRMIKV